MTFKSASLAGISIDRLRTLCAVVEAGSIAGAAGKDPNRQSQFSRQLKDLENALGLSLFDRAGKVLHPNATGRRVASAIQTFFGALDDVMDAAEGRAERVRFGASDAVLRWLVMPHLAELMAGDPPLRFEIHAMTTESAVRALVDGRIDLAILRTEGVPQDVQSEVVKTVHYVLAVPRSLLRSREAAEVFEGRTLPFAELAGDAYFTKEAQATASSLGLQLRPVLQAHSFSLLMSAVESGTAVAFLPEVAAKSLPEERFAAVGGEGMRMLNRSLSLTWMAHVANSRLPVRRAITRLRKVLA